MPDDDSIELLASVKRGDEEAARRLFARYVARLVPLARSRLSPKLARKVDAEDIVQSAYRSFFRAAYEGRYVLERSGDLWRLLAAITVNKVHRQVDYYQAAKRSTEVEQNIGSSSLLGVHPEQLANDPTPEDAVALAEELQALMSSLLPRHREMLEMRLQGATVTQISAQTDRTEHQVRRVLGKITKQLEERLKGGED